MTLPKEVWNTGHFRHAIISGTAPFPAPGRSAATRKIKNWSPMGQEKANFFRFLAASNLVAAPQGNFRIFLSCLVGLAAFQGGTVSE
jgi:hypothetical protein